MAADDSLFIGNLTQRIRIERLVRSADGQGGSALSYTLRAVVWAQMTPLSAREQIMASQMTAALTEVVRIWYRSDIAVTDRIVIGSRTLQITSVQDPTGTKDELRLLCMEVQGAPAAGPTSQHQGWIDSQLA